MSHCARVADGQWLLIELARIDKAAATVDQQHQQQHFDGYIADPAYAHFDGYIAACVKHLYIQYPDQASILVDLDGH